MRFRFALIVCALSLLAPHASAQLLPSPLPEVDLSDPATQDVTSWRFKAGDHPNWASTRYKDSTWRPVEPGTSWHTYGNAGYYGFGWFRARVNVTATGPRLQLHIDHD